MTEGGGIYPSTYKEQKRGENAKDLRRKFEKFLIAAATIKDKDGFPLSRE
jgi:hypothetical protein